MTFTNNPENGPALPPKPRILAAGQLPLGLGGRPRPPMPCG
jgi:hypothetical protein